MELWRLFIQGQTKKSMFEDNVIPNTNFVTHILCLFCWYLYGTDVLFRYKDCVFTV